MSPDPALAVELAELRDPAWPEYGVAWLSLARASRTLPERFWRQRVLWDLADWPRREGRRWARYGVRFLAEGEEPAARDSTPWWELLDGVPDRLARVLEAYFRRGLLLREIGEELGLSETHVCQLKRQAIELMRSRG